jgi:6-carboxyhexanoate--CoA ligase
MDVTSGLREHAWFSVRMRASRGGRHLSGAERLVMGAELEAVALALLRRGRDRVPDALHLTVDRIEEPIARTGCLRVTTAAAPDPVAATEAAACLLATRGIGEVAIATAFSGLRSGLGPDGAALRGAALLDAESGRRLEADPARGVRASRFDYAPAGREEVARALAAAGLGHFRTREALAVATKALWSGVLAEICWSDEPEYTAGYVATPGDGYVRFSQFKPPGSAGGRVFFVSDGEDVPALVERLERRPLLIEPPLVVTGP